MSSGVKPRLRTNRAAAAAIGSVVASGGGAGGGVVAGGSGRVAGGVEVVEVGASFGTVDDAGAFVVCDDDDSVVEVVEVGRGAAPFDEECELHAHIANGATAAHAMHFHANAGAVIRSDPTSLPPSDFAFRDAATRRTDGALDQRARRTLGEVSPECGR